MGPNLAEVIKNYSLRVKKFAAENSNSNAVVDAAEKINKAAGVASAVAGAVISVANLISSEKRTANISDAVGAVAGAVSAVAALKNDNK